MRKALSRAHGPGVNFPLSILRFWLLRLYLPFLYGAVRFLYGPVQSFCCLVAAARSLTEAAHLSSVCECSFPSQGCPEILSRLFCEPSTPGSILR
ncbi:hypothetical protein TNCV_2037301 [Trichonephila clavipes]|nr:hypothetical protein TNCV_2037301 [Trichonephila clavipes]